MHAFDFDFDHSFVFYNNFSKIFESSECYELFKDIEEEEGLEPTKCEGVKKTKVKKVFNEIGKQMLFLFDYGDNWHFTVELIDIKEKNAEEKYPSVLESVGKAPRQYE